MSFRDLSGSTDPDKLPLFKEIEREVSNYRIVQARQV